MENNVTEKIGRTIENHHMLEAGQTVIVAVSGGADSVTLLHTLSRLSNDLKITIIAAHLNHGIRGEESDQDQEFVEKLCSHLGIKLISKKVDVPSLSAEQHIGIEEAARRVRYEFLQTVAEQYCADKIATAHTADDQVETVLINILRGTGLDGLSGMPAVRDNIIRPMIDVTRADVESYLKGNGLSWRTDSSNLSAEYTRNRVRLELIPFLQEKFNPKVNEVILTLSRLAKDESEAMRIEAERAFSAAIEEKTPERITFDASVISSLPVAIMRRCLRMAIESVKGDLVDVEYEQVERIKKWVRLRRHFTLTLPSGVIYASHDGEELAIFRKPIIERSEFEHELVVPGRTLISEIGRSIETRRVSSDKRPKNRLQATVDLSKLRGKLIVRSWREGDRITPFGMTGSKKLQDLFVDLKVPQSQRWTIPIVSDDEKIVWVVGAAVSELVRITDETEIALWMECEALECLP